MPRDILDHLPGENAALIPAGRGRRFFAFVIDILPITLLIAWVFYAFFGFDEALDGYLSDRSDIEMRRWFIEQRNWIRSVSFLAWLFYSVVMDGAPWQGTFGKQWINTIKLSGLAAPKIKRRPRNNFKIILRQKNRAENTKNDGSLAILYWSANYQGYRKKYL